MRCLAILIVLASTTAFATDVTTCGQSVAPGDTGVLQQDLDCSGVSGPLLAAVLLQQNATLSLNGHTIVGRSDAPGVASDVARRCAVVGPGLITGTSTGITAAATRLMVQDVVLQGNGIAIDVSLGRLDVSNVTADSAVSGGRIRADGLTVTRDGDGNCIMARRLRGSDITVTGCHTGIEATEVVRATRLDARDNFTIGVTAKKVKLADSVVTGNIFIGQPLDILSVSAPILTNTTCGTSAQRLDDNTIGPTWGVCADD